MAQADNQLVTLNQEVSVQTAMEETSDNSCRTLSLLMARFDDLKRQIENAKNRKREIDELYKVRESLNEVKLTGNIKRTKEQFEQNARMDFGECFSDKELSVPTTIQTSHNSYQLLCSQLGDRFNTLKNQPDMSISKRQKMAKRLQTRCRLDELRVTRQTAHLKKKKEVFRRLLKIREEFAEHIHIQLKELDSLYKKHETSMLNLQLGLLDVC